MQKTIKLSSIQIDLSIELRYFRVTAYYRVSTEQEEQPNSIELQEQHYARLISENPKQIFDGHLSTVHIMASTIRAK